METTHKTFRRRATPQIFINQSNNNTVTNNITTAPNATPPAAPVISGDTVNNYGNATVTLNGTAEAGTTITVFDNSTQLGTTARTAAARGPIRPGPWRTAARASPPRRPTARAM